MNAALKAAFALETARVVQRRVSLAVVIYVAAIAAYGFLDLQRYPEHAFALSLRVGSHAAICALGLLLMRRHSGPHTQWFAAASVSALILAGSVYNASVGTPAERYAMFLGCLLMGTAVILPWGMARQAVAAGAAALAYLAASPYLPTPEGSAFGAYALLVVSFTTLGGALFLDRSRFEAFTRTAMLRDEAELSAALVRVGETLSAHLHEADMVERVNRLATELVDCDATMTFVWDPNRKTFVCGTATGFEPDGTDARLELTASRALLAQRLRPNEVVELAVTSDEELIPRALLRRCGASSAILVAMWRGDEMLGVMMHARRQTTEPFSLRQRELALGVAHTAAIAIANAGLIADLEHANHVKSEFVSTMSHELRTPLNVILGFTEMARDPEVAEAERDHCLARVDVAGRELLKLVDDTLDIARMDAGRDEARLEHVALPALWADLGAAATRIPHTESVSLLWNASAPDVALTTDPRKFTLIVRNLVGNALKFTGRGWVRVELCCEEGMLVLRVSDTGIGISEENQRCIFEMFRQVDGSDSRRHGGVGLGLHIVQRTVHQLGGTVVVESTLGLGSVFTVRLPFEQPPLLQVA